MGIDFSERPIRGRAVIIPADIPVWLYEPEPECKHIATVTAPLHVTHGQNVYTTDPVTICVTCHARVTTEGA